MWNFRMGNVSIANVHDQEEGDAGTREKMRQTTRPRASIYRLASVELDYGWCTSDVEATMQASTVVQVADHVPLPRPSTPIQVIMQNKA